MAMHLLHLAKTAFAQQAHQQRRAGLFLHGPGAITLAPFWDATVGGTRCFTCSRVLRRRKGKPAAAQEESPLSSVILCVDDDHTALTVRRLLLSIRGYAVLTATSPKAALGLFNCNHVDLVITDHLLQDGTGRELTLQLKRLKPEVPIVLLTAWANMPPGYEQADRLLSKGITPEEFLSEIASLLSNHSEDTRHSQVSVPPPMVA